MPRFVEILKLIRFVNCMLAMVGVGVGAYMTWLRPNYYEPLVAAAAAFLICAGGNIINDLVDVKVDRINRPDRGLVRGALSKKFATVLAALVNVAAILLSLAVNLTITTIALVVIALLLLYNLRLKRVPLAGNVVIAALGGLTFLTGGFAVDNVMALTLPGPLIPAAYAFSFHMVREIIKDVEDIEGDCRVGIKTLPQVIGVRNSLSLALLLFLILVILTYLPILTGWFGVYYQVITVYIIDLPLLLMLIFIWGNPTPPMLRIGSLSLKAGMGLGIVALILA
jgi:geranylgeranylglycerol-phosphate geranylgeranyltransferase